MTIFCTRTPPWLIWRSIFRLYFFPCTIAWQYSLFDIFFQVNPVDISRDGFSKWCLEGLIRDFRVTLQLILINIRLVHLNSSAVIWSLLNLYFAFWITEKSHSHTS